MARATRERPSPVDVRTQVLRLLSDQRWLHWQLSSHHTASSTALWQRPLAARCWKISGTAPTENHHENQPASLSASGRRHHYTAERQLLHRGRSRYPTGWYSSPSGGSHSIIQRCRETICTAAVNRATPSRDRGNDIRSQHSWTI